MKILINKSCSGKGMHSRFFLLHGKKKLVLIVTWKGREVASFHVEKKRKLDVLYRKCGKCSFPVEMRFGEGKVADREGNAINPLLDEGCECCYIVNQCNRELIFGKEVDASGNK